MNEMKKWAHRLADINEAIYDTEKEKKELDMSLTIAESCNDTARIARLKEKIRKKDQELERYNKKLAEHYKNKPKEE